MSRPAAGSHERWLPFVAAAAVVAADQLTKAWIVAALAPGERVAVVDGWFQLHFIVNRGGLFGLLRDLPGLWRTVLFSGIPLAACVGLTYFLLRAPRSQPLVRAGLACILGGAAGNLIDRLRLGHVIDFLDVFWRDHHWPAFNVADSAICVGVGLILLDAFLGGSARAVSPGAAEER